MMSPIWRKMGALFGRLRGEITRIFLIGPIVFLLSAVADRTLALQSLAIVVPHPRSYWPPLILVTGVWWAILASRLTKAPFTLREGLSGIVKGSLCATTLGLATFLIFFGLYPDLPGRLLAYFHVTALGLNILGRLWQSRGHTGQVNPADSGDQTRWPWRVAAYFDHTPHAPFVIAALSLLMACPFFLIAGREPAAERLANWAYGFLVLGVLGAFLQFWSLPRPEFWSLPRPVREGARWAVLPLVGGVLLASYGVAFFPAFFPGYERPRGVAYRWLSQQPGGFTVAEYPLPARLRRDDYLLWSAVDFKRLYIETRLPQYYGILGDITDPQAAFALDWLGVKYVLLYGKEKFNEGLTLVKSFPEEKAFVYEVTPSATVFYGRGFFDTAQTFGAGDWWMVTDEEAVLVITNRSDEEVLTDLASVAVAFEHERELQVLRDGQLIKKVVVPVGRPTEVSLKSILLQPGEYESLVFRLSDGEPGWRTLALRSFVIEQRPFEMPTPQHPLAANLGDRVKFLGYDIEPRDGKIGSGETLRLTLYWQALAEMDEDYTVFVHLIDDENRVYAQKDNQPVGGSYSTSVWKKDEIVRDEYSLAVPPDTPVGEYRLEVGMYLLSTMRRLEVLGASPLTRILLGPVQVW